MLKILFKIFMVLVLAFTGLLFYLAGASENEVPATLDEGATVSTAKEEVFAIAFGSCNREDKPQTYWPTIGKHQPDVWLWLGDNVYADTEDMDELAAAYRQQKKAPEYAAFAANVPAIFGIWDDHDYGLNDGGKEWPYKDAAKTHLLDFLDVPADAAVREHQGAYQSYRVGPEEHPIKIILLDTRYFRDPVVPPTKEGHRYGQNSDGDILGEAQWAWLEQELRDTSAQANIIASSIQVLPQEHGYEKWDNFPQARQRLLDLLAETQPKLPLLISGDRHLAEVSFVEHQGTKFHEITASGLTHSYEAADEPNAHRLSSLIGEKTFGLLMFLPIEGHWQLLAEIRSIDNNAVLATLGLGAQADQIDLDNYENQSAASMATELKPCPQSPNCVSTQSDQADKKREPIAYTGTLEEVRTKLKNTIAGMPRTKLKTESDNYLHYTFKTLPIPFIDDVEFLFDDDAKVIHYRSASRVGHSDLGANSRRMAKVVKAFHEQ